jgi:hypothetical protein
MCPEHHLPLRVAQGMLWHLGLPEDYFKRPEYNIGQDGFRVIAPGDGTVCQDDDDDMKLELIDDGKSEEMPLSVLQLNAIWNFGSSADVPIPLFQSKGLRFK